MHSTMVMGEGKNISIDHLKSLGESASLDKPRISNIISEVRDTVSSWSKFAKIAGVSAKSEKHIAKFLNMI